jgi:ligand-binding sensor domain-containing protein
VFYDFYKYGLMLSKFFKLPAIIIFLHSINCFAQPNLRFEHIMPEDGLSNNFINSIYQDSDGFLWFSTFSGLNRYDGYNFFVYESNDNPNSLSHNSIYSIKEDKKGNLWIGTEHGLNILNKSTNTIKRYMHKTGDINQLTNDNIRAIYEDNDGTIWIGTYGGGLNKLNPSTGEFSSYMNIPGDETSIISNKVNCINVDKDGIF